MKKSRIITAIILFLIIDLGIFCHAEPRNDFNFKDLLPKSSGEIIKHSYYTLSYSEKHEQAFWVFYTLTPAMVNGLAQRNDNFREDPAVSTGSATLYDYKGSGYDRGHLCPAASMSIDQIAMDESFLMSNMSPQVPSFNRGAWKKLEETVRNWAIAERLIYVATGPVLATQFPTIGSNRVTVPHQYYKIIYAPLKEKMIAFLLPNKKIDNSILDYIVSVDSIEVITGIDFFSILPDQTENRLESHSDINLWNIDN